MPSNSISKMFFPMNDIKLEIGTSSIEILVIGIKIKIT